jgi:hypothetical protein
MQCAATAGRWAGTGSSSIWDLQQHPRQGLDAGSRVVQRAIAVQEGGIYANPGLYDDVFSYRDFPKEVSSSSSSSHGLEVPTPHSHTHMVPCRTT